MKNPRCTTGLVVKALIRSAILPLAGCPLFGSDWHWHKGNSSDADYQADLRFCKTQTDQAIDGMATNASVRRIHACMENHGWRKVAN